MNKILSRSNINYLLMVLVFLVDLFLLYLMFIVAFKIRFQYQLLLTIIPPVLGMPSWEVYQKTIIAVIGLWAMIFLYTNLYREKFVSALDEIVLVVKAVSTGIVFAMALTFMYREYEYSRIVLGLAWVLAIVTISINHLILRFVIVRAVRLIVGPLRMMVMGQGRAAESILKILKRQPHIKVYYVPQLSVDKVEQMLETWDVEEVIIAQQEPDHKQLLSINDLCESNGIVLKFLPNIFELRMGEVFTDNDLGLPFLRLKSISLHGVNYYIKRFVDVVVSLLAISFLFPVLLGIVIAVLIDSSGPVFYKQKRMGHKGRIFDFYKFRTMVVNAERHIEKLRAQSDRQGPLFKMRDDPRVTRVGRFLRRFSIDELPQIINVLRGEMSLIGPRPQVLWETAAYDDFARKRLNVLPGITGLWQISGRADLSYEEMIQLDIYYVENWSLGMDLRILFTTLPVVLTAKGAY
ncbi:MAG: sugar transferase [Elusimicrobiota bacterium]